MSLYLLAFFTDDEADAFNDDRHEAGDFASLQLGAMVLEAWTPAIAIERAITIALDNWEGSQIGKVVDGKRIVEDDEDEFEVWRDQIKWDADEEHGFVTFYYTDEDGNRQEFGVASLQAVTIQ